LHLDGIAGLGVRQHLALLGQRVVSILARARDACGRFLVLLEPLVNRSPRWVSGDPAPLAQGLAFPDPRDQFVKQACSVFPAPRASMLWGLLPCAGSGRFS
jgi:hypothetical protein